MEIENINSNDIIKLTLRGKFEVENSLDLNVVNSDENYIKWLEDRLKTANEKIRQYELLLLNKG